MGSWGTTGITDYASERSEKNIVDKPKGHNWKCRWGINSNCRGITIGRIKRKSRGHSVEEEEWASLKVPERHHQKVRGGTTRRANGWPLAGPKGCHWENQKGND